jgi:putative transposase
LVVRLRRPGHLRGFSYLGFHRYHLRYSTAAQTPWFRESSIVDAVLAAIQRHADAEQFGVIAYSFMPDHVHLLVQGQTESADCLRFIARMKQSSGFACSRRFGIKLWQPLGFERVLRETEDTRTVARYILENPLRARLAGRVEDYPFLGSLVFPVRTLLEDISFG